MALVLSGCVAESDTPPPVVTIMPTDTKGDEPEADTAAICAAAAALPETDACSLVCDADAFKTRLLDDGMAGGNCYQLHCDLSATISVTVGVCLP